MGAETSLALRLRAALQEEALQAVEDLLCSGADPNLVLADGAAAVHLAARTRHPRSLRCLEALMRAGGDPNARSAEALTPLHVAAAWGCCRSLELLLSRGGDPALRDQDGLRPLDLAEQQGHQDCVRVLRDLGTRTWEPEPDPEPKAEPSGPDLLGEGQEASPSGSPDVTLDLTALGRGDARDMGLVAFPGRPSLLAHPEDDGSMLSRPGYGDYSSDPCFVTAVEASGTKDPAPPTSTWTGSWSQTRQGHLRVTRPSSTLQLVPGAAMASSEAELNTCLQALTLTLPGATPSRKSSPDRSPTQSPQRTLVPEPSNDVSSDSNVTTIWLTEDETSSTGVRDPVSSCWGPLVPPISDTELLQGLRALGESPGPVTPFTRPHYLRRLQEAQAVPGPNISEHSPELAKALQTGQIPDAQADEDALIQQFKQPDPTRRWREGVVKSSFTYLLLDPRETQDLPSRAFSLTPAECLRTFVRAIFYVGKGTRARPDAHLLEALGHQRWPEKQTCPKVRHILDIWASGRGVVSLHCFQHVVAVEAYTREACIMDALGIQRLTNQKQGHCYGVVAGWPPSRRRRLGVHLLHRALLVFLAEGERELRPQDIQAPG